MPGVVYPVHSNQFKIGTKGVDSTSEQMVMPADLENFYDTLIKIWAISWQKKHLAIYSEKVLFQSTVSVFPIIILIRLFQIGHGCVNTGSVCHVLCDLVNDSDRNPHIKLISILLFHHLLIRITSFLHYSITPQSTMFTLQSL